MKILVIEDQPTERKLACTVLNFAGFRVQEVETAEEALEAIEKEQPQVIMLDLNLPGIDGMALARQLKADALTCYIPIVAVTSYPDR